MLIQAKAHIYCKKSKLKISAGNIILLVLFFFSFLFFLGTIDFFFFFFFFTYKNSKFQTPSPLPLFDSFSTSKYAQIIIRETLTLHTCMYGRCMAHSIRFIYITMSAKVLCVEEYQHYIPLLQSRAGKFSKKKKITGFCLLSFVLQLLDFLELMAGNMCKHILVVSLFCTHVEHGHPK